MAVRDRCTLLCFQARILLKTFLPSTQIKPETDKHHFICTLTKVESLLDFTEDTTGWHGASHLILNKGTDPELRFGRGVLILLGRPSQGYAMHEA